METPPVFLFRAESARGDQPRVSEAPPWVFQGEASRPERALVELLARIFQCPFRARRIFPL